MFNDYRKFRIICPICKNKMTCRRTRYSVTFICQTQNTHRYELYLQHNDWIIGEYISIRQNNNMYSVSHNLDYDHSQEITKITSEILFQNNKTTKFTIDKYLIDIVNLENIIEEIKTIMTLN